MEALGEPEETLPVGVGVPAEVEPAEMAADVTVEGLEVTAVVPELMVAAEVVSDSVEETEGLELDDDWELDAVLAVEGVEDAATLVLGDGVGVGVDVTVVDTSAVVVVVDPGIGTAEVSLEPAPWLAVVSVAVPLA